MPVFINPVISTGSDWTDSSLGTGIRTRQSAMWQLVSLLLLLKLQRKFEWFPGVTNNIIVKRDIA